jgi:hypothetical protein
MINDRKKMSINGEVLVTDYIVSPQSSDEYPTETFNLEEYLKQNGNRKVRRKLKDQKKYSIRYTYETRPQNPEIPLEFQTGPYDIYLNYEIVKNPKIGGKERNRKRIRIRKHGHGHDSNSGIGQEPGREPIGGIGQEPGRGPIGGIDQEPGRGPIGGIGQEPGRGPIGGIGQEPGRGPIGGIDQEPGRGPIGGIDQEPGREPIGGIDQEPGRGPIGGIGQEPGRGPIGGIGQGPGRGPIGGIGQGPGREPIGGIDQEPGRGPIGGIDQEPGVGPVGEIDQEPGPETIGITEIKEAMEKYLSEETSENKVVRVVKNYKNRAKYWLIPLALLMALSAGVKTRTEQNSDLNDPSIRFFNVINQASLKLKYEVTFTDIQEVLEHSSTITTELLEQINLGDTLPLVDGLTFNTNSLGTGTNKTLGQEFNSENKFAGDYQISGFSIIYPGADGQQKMAYIEDFYSEGKQQNLNDFVEDFLKNNPSLTLEDLGIQVHCGVTKKDANGNILSKSRLGWIDITSLMSANVITQDTVNEVIEDSCSITGSISNFKGNTIEIEVETETGIKKVSIPVKDANGNYLSSGTTVIGSDGKEYTLSEISVQSERHKEISTITTKGETTEESTKLTYDIKDCAKALAIAGPLAALTYLALSEREKRKNAEYAQNPYFDTPENSTTWFKEFIDAGEKRREERSLGQELYNKFISETTQYGTKLTDRQINAMEAAAISYSGFSPEDSQVSIQKGTFTVYNPEDPDHQLVDVTEATIQDVYKTGSGNEQTEGYNQEATEYTETRLNSGRKGR